MQKIRLTTTPTDASFEVPYSTGYQTYSGLLSVLDEMETSVADTLHDATFGGLSNSGLLGWFRMDADRSYHKAVDPSETYDLHLGVTHPDDRAAFEALVRAFVIEDRNVPLAHGELDVVEVSTDQTTQQELLDRAATVAPNATGVRMRFRSTTCLERYDDVWEMYPERVLLFQQLMRRWNAVAEDEATELALTADAVGSEVYERAETHEYETRSIVVHRREPAGSDAPSVAADGGHLNEAQGFVGEWEYRFKDATAATKTAVIALSLFAEYAGVGRHTARGAGSVASEVLSEDQ